MKRYATISDFQNLPLAQVEKTIDRYIEIAEQTKWVINPAFAKQLEMLIFIAEAKGTKRKW